MKIKWEYIEKIMKSKGVTNGKMTKILGIGMTTWGRYKTNSTDIPLKIFYKVLEILDLKLDDVIIKSNIMEYRDYLNEARYDEDELEKRIQIVDDVLKELEECKTVNDIKRLEFEKGLFGDEILLKITMGYIEHNTLCDKIYD